MTERFPFFYYDAVARIIPAAAFLATLWVAGVNLPGLADQSANKNLPDTEERSPPDAEKQSTTDSEKPGLLDSAIVGIIYLGGCYALGVIFEAVIGCWPLNDFLDRRHNRAFDNALRDRSWRRPPDETKVGSAAYPKKWKSLEKRKWWEFWKRPETHLGEFEDNPKEIKRHCWNWLTLQPRRGMAQAFAHAHRFSAESKMFLFMTGVALWFLLEILAVQCSRPFGVYGWRLNIGLLPASVIGIVVAMLSWLGFKKRTERRYVQVLVSLDELWNKADKDKSATLIAICERYRLDLSAKTHEKHSVGSRKKQRGPGLILGFLVLIIGISFIAGRVYEDLKRSP